MVLFARSDQLSSYILKLRLDSGEEHLKSSSLVRLLEEASSRVVNIGKKLGYVLPTSPSAPKSNRDLLLEALVLEDVVSSKLVSISAQIDPILNKLAEYFRKHVLYTWRLFEEGRLDYAFIFVLANTSFATIEDIQSRIPMPLIDEYSEPTRMQVEELISRESAKLHALAAFLGFSNEILFKEIVADSVAGYILLSKSILNLETLLSSESQAFAAIAFDKYQKLWEGVYV